jgi:hypothetical protein
MRLRTARSSSASTGREPPLGARALEADRDEREEPIRCRLVPFLLLIAKSGFSL